LQTPSTGAALVREAATAAITGGSARSRRSAGSRRRRSRPAG
jgi:hypothetical protein